MFEKIAQKLNINLSDLKKWWFLIFIPIIFAVVIALVLISNSNKAESIATEISNGNFEAAETLLIEYEASNPSDVKTYEFYADFYLAQNEPETAIKMLEKGLREVSSDSKEKLQNRIDSIKSEYDIEEPTVAPTKKPTEKKKEKPTVSPAEVEKQFKDSCGTIDFETLARNPDKYKGNNYKFTGQVIQVQEGWLDQVELRINITKEEFDYIDEVLWTDTIYATIELPDGSDNILEDDIITFWGTCEGEYTYKSVLGDRITLPKITIEYCEIYN